MQGLPVVAGDDQPAEPGGISFCARQMLLDLQTAGHGGDKLFTGLQTFDYADPNEPVISAEATMNIGTKANAR